MGDPATRGADRVQRRPGLPRHDGRLPPGGGRVSLHARPHLNSARRRARKAQLAARDGWRCAYCSQRFWSLDEATMDHVVPISLYRTWSASALVLACLPCNRGKADRFPLLIALLLIRLVDRVDAPPVHPVIHPTSPLDRSTLPAAGSRPVESGGSPVDRVDVHRSPEVFTPAVLRLLARLARACQSADRTAPELGGRSSVHQGVHRVHSHPRTAAHRSSHGERTADRPARTRLCTAPHGPARTPRRESA
ncbi:HNH endonuclease [Streptomyces goshikiensis]|uniref:HNH endonuclease n=1 Tax=Streptomyces goshikiensis TaxID=1942 RepID=UPI0037D4CCFA